LEWQTRKKKTRRAGRVLAGKIMSGCKSILRRLVGPEYSVPIQIGSGIRVGGESFEVIGYNGDRSLRCARVLTPADLRKTGMEAIRGLGEVMNAYECLQTKIYCDIPQTADIDAIYLLSDDLWVSHLENSGHHLKVIGIATLAIGPDNYTFHEIDPGTPKEQ
jgi:hypothetical protein